jgi:hypothetical protein
MRERFALLLIALGLGLVVASLVFIYYFLTFMGPSQYEASLELLKLALANDCTQRRLLNQSFDYNLCLTSAANLTQSPPSYQRAMSNFLSSNDSQSGMFFAPLALGSVLMLAGIAAKLTEKRGATAK